MTRRGFSFLEAVLAAALLAVVAASIFSVLSYAMNSDRTDEARLGAAEIANRVIISYLDDSTSVDKLPDTIDYGIYTFRWDLDEDKIRIEEPNRRNRVTAGRQGAVPTALTNLQEVRVTVWLDEGRPETRAPGASPGVRLTRLVNPLGFGSRGDDSMQRLMQDAGRISDLLQTLTGFEDPDADGGG
ncbi:MAG: hypothetical protein Phyf2KO_22120 [Phycisphaerales bacterium]